MGGVGISNAVSAYIGERQRSIATLRSLGATGPRILVHFFTQIGILSLVGIGIGLVIGAGADGGRAAGARPHPRRQPAALDRLAVAGVRVGLRRARRRSRSRYLPLVRARKAKPAMLFRTVGTSVQNLEAREYLEIGVHPAAARSGLGIFGLAWLMTSSFQLVFWYAVGVIGAFLLLRSPAGLLQGSARAAADAQYDAAQCVPRHLPPGFARAGGDHVARPRPRDAAGDRHPRVEPPQPAAGQMPKDAPTFVATDLFDDEIVDLQTSSSIRPASSPTSSIRR